LTLSAVGNLDLLYQDRGMLSEAEKMFVQTLQGFEETLGPKSTLTLNAANHLGILYMNKGKLGEAERMFV
jgi:TolA-binding protein